MKFKRRQAVVEAFQFGHDPEPPWFKQAIEWDWAVMYPNSVCLRTTYRSVQTVFKGDWIVLGYDNIPYGVRKNEFDRLYVPLEET